MNLEIRKLKMGLISYIDKVDLPAEVKRMIVKEVYADMEQKANAAVRQEITAEDGVQDLEGKV